MLRRNGREKFDINLAASEVHVDSFAQSILRARFEHKFDPMSAQTGNLFIELSQGRPQRPSGLEVTEADWWAHEYYPDWHLLMPTRHLRAAVRWAYDVKGLRPTPGGDNDNYGLCLPIQWFVRHALLRAWAEHAGPRAGLTVPVQEPLPWASGSTRHPDDEPF